MSTLPYTQILIPPVLNPKSITDLTNQLIDAEKENARYILVKGSGDVFCNGLDLALVANSEQGNHLKDMQAYGEFLKKLSCGKFISIAHVNGTASGGGMGIVCACDQVIADEASTFALPEGLFGLIPGMILPALLKRLTPQRIKKMVLTGKKYSAQIALEWGIADEVIKNSELESTINDAINTTRNCKPGAVSDLKQMLYSSHLNKDELANLGMDILSKRLQDPEIKQRLKDISDFMED